MVFLTKILDNILGIKEQPKTKIKKYLKREQFFNYVITKNCITVSDILIHTKRNTIVKKSPRRLFVYNPNYKYAREYEYVISESNFKQLIERFE